MLPSFASVLPTRRAFRVNVFYRADHQQDIVMASAGAPSDEERIFNRAQLKLNLNLPSVNSPHSLSELQSIAEEIQRQKYCPSLLTSFLMINDSNLFF